MIIKIIYTAALCCLLTSAGAQVFPVDTIAKTGSLQNRVNLVFLGDGYKSTELTNYSSDVRNFINGIFAQSPFQEYKNYFNAFAVKVPSPQSGVTHPQNTSDNDCSSVPILTADTYFGSTFDTDGIHRLLAPTKNVKVYSVLSLSFPLYDQAFIVVNAPYYGGSGGAFATASTNSSANEVAVHEIGHSFAFLADEYWAGPQYAAEKPNLTQESSATKIKWKNWLNHDGIGIYPHAEDPTWFRPHQNCKMRYLNVPFCDVCRETFIERIHDLVNPVESYAPIATTLPSDKDIDFSVTTLLPIPNTLKVTWTKNDTVISKNVNNVIVHASSLVTGQTSIRATVIDTTTLSRSASHTTKHVYVTEWKIGKDVIMGIDISPNEYRYKLSVYPNPTQDIIHISYSTSRTSDVKITLNDMNGRKLQTLANEKQLAGEYEFKLTREELNMNENGVYLLNLNINGTIITERLIRE